MDKETFLRYLADATKTFIVEQLAPLRDRLNIDSDRLDHLEARLHDLEAKEPAKLYEVPKPKIHARV